MFYYYYFTPLPSFSERPHYNVILLVGNISRYTLVTINALTLKPVLQQSCEM